MVLEELAMDDLKPQELERGREREREAAIRKDKDMGSIGWEELLPWEPPTNSSARSTQSAGIDHWVSTECGVHWVYISAPALVSHCDSVTLG